MQWGPDEWRITDHFGQEWRLWIVRPEARDRSAPPISRWDLRGDPIDHLIYFSFNESRVVTREAETARDLVEIYDALTGSDLAFRLTEGARDPRRRLWGIEEELNRVLYGAIEVGLLKYERHEVPWPFPEKEEKKEAGASHEPTRDAESTTLRIWLHDRKRQRMPDAPYRLRIGNETRRGSANDQGLMVERDVTIVGECTLEWGSLPDDLRDGSTEGSFRFMRTLRTGTAHDDALHNLGYEGDSSERLAAFQKDYSSTHQPTDVHQQGVPAPSRKS